jgi:NADH-ubiquinone oxidoreductase chain 6
VLLSNRFIFLTIKHPLSIGLALITQTLFLSLFTGIYTSIFWFSYSLFLIFIGGILILFIYITSLASNETFIFSLNFKPSKFFFLLITIIIIFVYLTDFKSLFIINKTLNSETFNLIFIKTLIEQNNLILNKIYNFPINIITIILVNYLFLTLIATVKITNIFKGPLRPKTL